MSKESFSLVQIGNHIHIAETDDKYALWEFTFCGLSCGKNHPNDIERDVKYVIEVLKGSTKTFSDIPKSKQVMCSKCLAKALKLINSFDAVADEGPLLLLAKVLKAYVGEPSKDELNKLAKGLRNKGKVIFESESMKKHIRSCRGPLCGGLVIYDNKNYDDKNSIMAYDLSVKDICERCLAGFFKDIRSSNFGYMVGNLNVPLWAKYEKFIRASIIEREKSIRLATLVNPGIKEMIDRVREEDMKIPVRWR